LRGPAAAGGIGRGRVQQHQQPDILFLHGGPRTARLVLARRRSSAPASSQTSSML
jgi:hypothetical protein